MIYINSITNYELLNRERLVMIPLSEVGSPTFATMANHHIL